MIKVNLLSPEKKEISGGAPEAPGYPAEEAESNINKGAVIAAVVITLGVSIGLYLIQTNTIDKKKQKLAVKQARKQELDNVLKMVDDLEKAKARVDRKIKLISELKSSQQDVVKMMDALCNALPDWVMLTNLNISNKDVKINGYAIHNNLISDFINNLKGTGFFYNIHFPGSTRQVQMGQEVFSFSLNCNYKDKNKAVDKNKTIQP